MSTHPPKRKGPLLLQHKEFIVFFNSLPIGKKKKILCHLTTEQIKSISEIFSNFLKRNLTLNKNIIKRASKCKKELRQVALKNTPIKTKIKILSGKRGGSLLGILLPAAVSFISSLIAGRK